MSRMEGGGGRHHHHHHHHHGSSGLLSSPLVLALVASGTLAFVLLSWRWSSRLSVLQDSSTSSSSSTRNDAGAVGAQDEGLPPALAQQAQQLRAIYARVHDEFTAEGLDLAFIESMHSWFHGWNAGETTWPKQYVQMEPPLPAHSVRLLVLPLDECPSISSAAAAAAAKVAGLLPSGTKIFSNARTQYHCTVFHTSHPSDPRPDPFSPQGGLASPPALPHERPPPPHEVLDRELEHVTRVVSDMQGPELEVDSVVMAKTGTLLLTWVDRSGLLTELRHRMRATFPGASTKQASIVHTSLLRVVGATQLEPEAVERINQTCAHFTQLLRGRRYAVRSTWWIDEAEFSTIVGERHVVPFGKQRHAGQNGAHAGQANGHDPK